MNSEPNKTPSSASSSQARNTQPQHPHAQITKQQAQPNNAPRITVEDLLHFKRAERPSPEFWAGFEKQLKQRQIAAAIQSKRAWWQAIPLMLTFPRLAFALPVGAAAALTISFVLLHDTPASSSGGTADVSGQKRVQSVASVTVPATVNPGIAQNTTSANETSATLASSRNFQTAQVNVEKNAPNKNSSVAEAKTISQQHDVSGLSSSNTVGQDTGEMIAQQENPKTSQPYTGRGAQTSDASRSDLAALSRGASPLAFAGIRPANTHFAGASVQSLAAMPAGAMNSITVFSSTDLTSAYAQVARDLSAKDSEATSDTEVAAGDSDEKTGADKTGDFGDSGDSRRERLMAYMSAPSPTTATSNDNPRAVRVRERVTSRISDKALSDTISRFGATGDSLSIKF